MSDWYTVRAKNVKSANWFEIKLMEKQHAYDMARAFEESELWIMVSLRRDTEESVEDWRE